MNKTFYALVLIILSVGLYFTVTADIIAEAMVIKGSNDKYLEAIEKASELISVREKVLADYNQLSIEDRENLGKLVPKNVDNIRLIIDLNNIASQSNVALTGITISASDSSANIPPPPTRDGSSNVPNSTDSSFTTDIAPPPSATLEKVSVSFSLTASYQQFISFMQVLESSLRILDVSGITLTSTDDGLYTWGITLQTYWLRNQ